MTTKTVEGVLDDVQVKGPFKAKTGDHSFNTHEYYLEGEKFAKFANVGVDPEFSAGDSVTILASEGQGAKGTYNKIIQIGKQGTKLEAKTTVKKTYSKPMTTSLSTATQTTSSTATSGTKTYTDNTKGLIKGNSVTNGIQLAIARYGKSVTTQEIINCAREVLSVHKALDEEQ